MEKGKRKKFRRVSWESLITTLDFARIIRNGRRGGKEERDGVSFSQWSRNVMDRTSRSSIPGITNERRLLVALLFFLWSRIRRVESFFRVFFIFEVLIIRTLSSWNRLTRNFPFNRFFEALLRLS